MSTIIDITRPIHAGMALYPGNPGVVFEQVAKAAADSSALTKISLGSHTGTHIDAPSHIKAGADGTAAYDLEPMIGPAEVIELKLKDQKIILAEDLPEITAERVVIKTRNSDGDPNVFDPDFVALDESAAQRLVDSGVQLIGIDGPSIKKKGVRDRVHAILLDANVIVLEGLWLANVSPDTYELLCLPLAVDLDGAPARVVLRQTS